MPDISESLLNLAHELGREDRKLSILGEGNVSATISNDQLMVKASGVTLATLTLEDLTACRSSEVLRLLEQKVPSDSETESALLESQINPKAKKPSTETVFHAWLLTLENVA